MNLLFVTEARFSKCPNGNIFSSDNFNYQLWCRYLDEFEKIYILCRVQRVDYNIEESNFSLSSGKNVIFIEIPYYIGITQFLVSFFNIIYVIFKQIRTFNGSILLRIPGTLGIYSWIFCRIFKKSYSVEVVGDPDDVFTRANFNSYFIKFVRFIFVTFQKYIIKYATCSCFVTRDILQLKYPPLHSKFTTNISNVYLDDDSLINYRKLRSTYQKKTFNLVSIGSLDQLYKSPDVVIKVISNLNSMGLNTYLTWIGDGRYKASMIEFCKELGCEDKIKFIGKVPLDQVFSILDSMDLFVLASRTEGLPRAIIEAMAIGLPCIGTNAGGIPELLPKEYLVDVDNSIGLTELIKSTLTDNLIYEGSSSYSLSESRNYFYSVLKKRRSLFLKMIIKYT